MLRLLFLSNISLLAVACGDDDCGFPGAPTFGILASNADVTLTYGNLTAGENNDCPAADAPDGVVSLTIEGSQQDGPGLITLCIPRPDTLADKAIPLGTDGARIIDLNGEADGCSYAFEATRPVTGTVSAKGMCDNGADPAGFALVVDGAVSLRRTCPASMDTIAVSFQGTAEVVPR